MAVDRRATLIGNTVRVKVMCRVIQSGESTLKAGALKTLSVQTKQRVPLTIPSCPGYGPRLGLYNTLSRPTERM